VDLAPIQRLVFRDMWFKNYVICVAGRGYGKTFALGLLAALSAMLYPGNRIGLIGPVFRQCFPIISGTYDTLWTSNGLYSTVEDFYESISTGYTKVQSFKSNNTIINKWKNIERDCILIESNKGFEVSGTIDHRILVLGNDLSFIYKELQDITEDDYIVIRKGFNYFGNDNSMPNFDEFVHDWRTKDCIIPKELTPDLAYWMGLIVGDGCVSVSKNKRKQRVDFVSEDQGLLDSFDRYLREYFLVNKEEHIRRDNRKNNTWEIEYFCKKLVQYLLKCGFTKTTALDKKVPDVIKKASREIFIAFLQGLFDTDGSVYIQQHKHGYPHCEVSFNTSSKRLVKEIQSVLLNLGIISNLNLSNKACIKQLSQGHKPSKCSDGYKLRITGYEDLYKFNELIGFRFDRKSKLLHNYLVDMNLKRSNTFVPATNTNLLSALVELKNNCTRGSNNIKLLGKIINRLKQGTKKLNLDTIESLLIIYDSMDSYKNNVIDNLKVLVNFDVFFIKPKNITKFKAPSIDIEVENEHCYWANGFINHNSKMIFSEVEKLYDQSSILREATAKRPTRGSDTCYLKFKAIGGKTPSYIEALPLGDGNKIRGSRFYLILVDELAQVPDMTLDLVLRPMGATALAPMERVRRLEEKKRLIDAGLAQESDFADEKVNKMIMTSSGYYKFNHMWRRMKDHWRMMNEAEEKGEDCSYAVWQVPYWDLPEGFLDLNNIAEAKRIMSSSEYSMEYEAAMISDSEGFFKASMLEECTVNSDFTLKMRGVKDKNYIIGVDPNQGGRASCGVIIIEMGMPNKIVNVIELKTQTTQALTTAIQNFCDHYNVIRIFMDRGGGGKAVCDLLEEGYGDVQPIIDRTNPDHTHLEGRHILEMVNFNPSWISDANFTTKAMLEDKSVLFPAPPVDSTSDAIANAYKSVEVLKSQLLNIVVTQTPTGILHFDTPTKGMNKDLYSALILAAHGTRMVERELEEEGDPILYNESGLVRGRNTPNQSFDYLGATGNLGFGGNKIASRVGLSAAVLKKKPK
jgi:intein/homing endonuclease